MEDASLDETLVRLDVALLARGFYAQGKVRLHCGEGREGRGEDAVGGGQKGRCGGVNMRRERCALHCWEEAV